LPLALPRRLARFNRTINNPLQLRYAWLLPPWAVICHTGRRSGRSYRTPVNAYRRGRTLAVVVLYGESSDWVQNVLAGGGRVVRAGRTYDLLDPRVVAPHEPVPLPALARVVGRLSQKLLVATLSPPEAGFGRGPAAG
jgi:deazaflavin-dependent oxidoreductase (nitroreductase family)